MKRAFFVHHQMQGSGKFFKEQKSKDFPAHLSDQQIASDLAQQFGLFHDDSWKAVGGFVDGIRIIPIAASSKPHHEPAGPQEQATEQSLFGGVELQRALSTKPKTKLP